MPQTCSCTVTNIKDKFGNVSALTTSKKICKDLCDRDIKAGGDGTACFIGTGKCSAKSKANLKGLLTQSSTYNFDDWKRARQILRPPDQLPLNEAELKEEIFRVLSSKNLLQPDNLVEFNYAQGCFLPQPLPGSTVILLNLKGTLIHRDTDEAKKQIAIYGNGKLEEFSDEEETEEKVHVQEEETLLNEGEDEEEEREDETEDQTGEVEIEGKVEEEEEVTSIIGHGKKLTNQFNFCERASLTYNNPSRSQETQTIPPPRGTFGDTVLQWVIYDAYDEDYAIQKREKERDRKVPAQLQRKSITNKKKKTSVDKEEYKSRLLASWKILERMVNLNTYDDIAKDFRYWEDPSDEFRDEEGTLLPLWKFTYEKIRNNTVTDIKWNPWYYDLFAVCYGSFNFMEQTSGCLCLFSIKNPSYPEYICVTESGVMCVDIHPKYPFMIVVGLYDGNVLIYNISVTCTEPQYKSNSVMNKHSGIVWMVKWAPNLQDTDMNFYSIGADGKINNWILMQNALSLTTIITLTLDQEPILGPDGSFVKLKGSASCMIFHPKNHLIFYVGTEEGFIYKCSTLYSSTYLFTYQAHNMPVYLIHFNKFNTSIFASCSGDWRIKIWEDNRPEPLFVFDLGASVGSVKWAPYSSTVFAATSAGGRVHVFDLNVNKYRAICVQNIVTKRKNILTGLSFNKKLPVLIVGDDKGCVHTLKLSPNLRIPCKPPKKQQYLDQFTLQCMKLDKLLALVREPSTLTPPEDVESTPDT